MNKDNQKIRLQSYFQFTKLPFTKYMWASKMYTSLSQQELISGLQCFLEIKGIALVYGPTGAGKSISLRRFKEELDPHRYSIFYFWNVRQTPMGFLRMMCRLLSLPFSMQRSDMMDDINSALGQFEEQENKHPVLIFDNCENLTVEILEHLRLLTTYAMDSEDRFSIILVGSERLLDLVSHPICYALKQRIGFSQYLTGFNVDDAKKYVKFHLERAEGPADLFDDDAIQLLFQASKGYPRLINQIAIHALINAALKKKDHITKAFLNNMVLKQGLFLNIDTGGAGK